MTATDELRRMLDERGVEYMLDQRYRELFWDFGESGRARASAIGTKGFVQMIVTGLTPEQAIAATLGPVITGDTSDGYHTFNELYHHRAVLFSVIVRDHADLAWKSKAHHDGTMYDGMFIVGIETPQGQATYHYDINHSWGMFECKELDRAPEWDGHTPDEAIARIATLGDTDATATRHGGADKHNSKLFEAARKWMAKAAHFEAENARLKQELESVGTAAYLYGRTDLADENAKLRELMRDIYEDMWHGGEWLEPYDQRMRELGIEVSV